MLDIQTQLFEGQDIRLAPIDHDAHPAIESGWTHDAVFMHLMWMTPVRPLSPALVKKEYESIEKKIETDRNLYYFAICTRTDDRLVGKAILQRLDWTNGQGWIRLGIGAAEDRRRGLGSQALRLLLHFAFAELNLYRVSALVPEYNEAAVHMLHRFGFMEEVRRRQAVERDGRRRDLLTFGLLRPEWESRVRG